MSLIIHDIDQNTEDWAKVRSGKVTGSSWHALDVNGKQENGFGVGAITLMKQIAEEMDNENNDIEKAVKPTELENLKLQVVEALDIYQGEDKEELKKLCAEKSKAGDFTVEFGKNILKQVS